MREEQYGRRVGKMEREEGGGRQIQEEGPGKREEREGR
jgi:hypothetical protein